jgi:hypothetical protein
VLAYDETRDEIEHNARLDERDEIVEYLRMMSRRMVDTIKEHSWWKRAGIMAGAAALHMAAEVIGQRHRRHDFE